ncbi:putative Ig domain-containing protein [Methanolobus sp. ZRKC5]|uniref:putative Ig domain-containing protein n=1 Tax=unclassified Methanolobus TaxID=2629569 RepID=UPI00313BCC14
MNQLEKNGNFANKFSLNFDSKTRLLRNLKVLLLLAFTLFILTSSTCYASEYYVADWGSDDNEGSFENPWETLNKAAAYMIAGDTTYVMDGTYYPVNDVDFRNSGTQSEPITLVAFNGRPKVVGTQSIIGMINFNGQQFINVSGFEITGAKRQIQVIGSNNTLHNCVVHGSYQENTIHISSGSSNLLIDNNVFYNQSGGHNLMDISSSYSYGRPIHDVTISNNEFYNVTGHNVINIKDRDNLINTKTIYNLTIINNIIHDVDKDNPSANSFPIATNHINLYTSNISNNLIYDCGKGVSLYLVDSTVKNNTMYNIANGLDLGTNDRKIYNTTYEGNSATLVLYGEGIVVKNPSSRSIVVSGESSSVTVNDMVGAKRIILKYKGSITFEGDSGQEFEVLKISGSDQFDLSSNTLKLNVDSSTIFLVTPTDISEESPVSSGTGLSFTPSATSLTANTGESTTFTVDSGQEFTSALWYLDGSLVESGTTNHVENWETAGTHTVKFDGIAAAGTISRTWTAVVSEPVESVYSSISISPSTTTVAPGESFSLDVYIDPAQSLTGSQFDLHYSQLASISSVNEGGLFLPDIFATTFEYGSIDNTFGILSHVYSAIVGTGTISQAGVMATVDMVAGSDSGILELELANVILSDASSNPAAYTVSSATVLVDTAPEFTSISAKSVDEAQSLSFIVSAIDADGDDLTYTATSLPTGAFFDTGTATFSWTPSEGDAGSYEAAFEVTDGYLTDTVSVSIIVTPLNHLPVMTLFEPADNSVFEEGSTINVNVVASDEDGQSLGYIIKIDGSQVSTASSYAWNLDYESAGTHTIEVIVSDGIDEVSSSSTVTITDLQPRWDVNEDGIVNVLDITLIGQNYGQSYTSDLPRWDVNQDSTVNIQDLSIVAGHFGETV